MSSHARSVIHNGYTVIDDVFPPHVRQAWYDTLHRLRNSTQPSVYSTVSWYRNILEHCPDETFEAATHPELLYLLEELMGPLVQLDGASLVAFAPVTGAASPVRGWHRDRWAEFPVGAYTVPRAVHVLCYLQDIDETSGPLRVIPGSHIQPLALQPEQEIQRHPEERLLFPRAGQAVVLHNKLLHSGSLHESGGLRSFCSLCFNQCWMRQPDDFSGPNCQRLISQVRAAGDPRLQRLLGVPEQCGAGFNRSNCGFLRPDESYWQQWIEEDRFAGVES